MSYARSKNLTVFDVLTIASMIEDEAGLPSQRKLVAAVIYNRLREGMPLGIDATIRFATGNYTAAADRIGTGDRLALQHAHQRRPAAGADQQPRPRLDRGRRPPGEESTTSSTSSSPAPAASSPSPRPKPNSKPTSPLQLGPRSGRRQLAGHLRGIARCRGSRSSATRSATRARRRCRTRRWRRWGWADEWSYEAIEVAPEGFEARVREMPGEGFAGANVTVPHKGAALGAGRRAAETAREIGAANTLVFADGEIRADNTDADGLLARAARLARRQAGAGARRRRRRARRGLGAAARGRRGRRSGTAPSCARGTSARSWAASPVDDPDQAAYELIVNTTAVGLARRGPVRGAAAAADGFAPGADGRRHGLRRRADRAAARRRGGRGRRPSTGSRSSSSRARSRWRSGPAARRPARRRCAPPARR